MWPTWLRARVRRTLVGVAVMGLALAVPRVVAGQPDCEAVSWGFSVTDAQAALNTVDAILAGVPPGAALPEPALSDAKYWLSKAEDHLTQVINHYALVFLPQGSPANLGRPANVCWRCNPSNAYDAASRLANRANSVYGPAYNLFTAHLGIRDSIKGWQGAPYCTAQQVAIADGDTHLVVEESHSQACSAMEPGTNRPGLDYRSFDLPNADPAACQATCAAEGKCVAWTYVAPGLQGPQARCWLKDRVPSPVPGNGTVSGTCSAGDRPGGGSPFTIVGVDGPPEVFSGGPRLDVTVRYSGSPVFPVTATLRPARIPCMTPAMPPNVAWHCATETRAIQQPSGGDAIVLAGAAWCQNAPRGRWTSHYEIVLRDTLGRESQPYPTSGDCVAP